jgi:hypothetical protein
LRRCLYPQVARFLPFINLYDQSLNVRVLVCR